VKRPGNGSASATFTVTVTGTTGYNGTVKVSVTGATTGLALSSPTTSAPGGIGTWKFDATVTSSSKKGNHALTVTGKDDTNATKSVSASLVVN
jgi:hypothetical protein